MDGRTAHWALAYRILPGHPLKSQRRNPDIDCRRVCACSSNRCWTVCITSTGWVRCRRPHNNVQSLMATGRPKNDSKDHIRGASMPVAFLRRTAPFLSAARRARNACDRRLAGTGRCSLRPAPVRRQLIPDLPPSELVRPELINRHVPGALVISKICGKPACASRETHAHLRATRRYRNTRTPFACPLR